MSNEITNATRLHDERLLELRQLSARAHDKLDSAASWLRGVAGQYKRYTSRTGYEWKTSRTDMTPATVADAIAKMQQLVAEGDAYTPMYSGRPSEHLAKYEAALAAWNATLTAISDHEKDYTGWERYWLCCSSNGHVHHAHCSSFRHTTRIALVPSLSGASVEAAVLSLGPIMCTKCFPAAPTEWTDSKLPESVITVLYERGEEAFREALEAWKIKKSKKEQK